MKLLIILVIGLLSTMACAQNTEKLMTDKKPTLTEIHQFFAADCNTKTWDLLDKQDRTADDNESMLNLAYASAWHWSQCGNEANHQRAEWILARVCTVLGYSEEALRHANKCMELTVKFKDKLEDFDVAYAHEALARLAALKGDKVEWNKQSKAATEAGNNIENDEDKNLFFSDFTGGNWYGMK